MQFLVGQRRPFSSGASRYRASSALSIDHEPSSRRVADGFPVLIAFEIVPLATPHCRAASPNVSTEDSPPDEDLRLAVAAVGERGACAPP